jgi:ribosomal-protein-alanine N-acetyltransferase
MEMTDDTIRTDNLMLRRFNVHDAPSMLKNWISDKEIQSNYGEPVYDSIEKIEELINLWTENYTVRNYHRWAIISLKENENIGQIAFCSINNAHNCVAVEYCIGKKYQNRGYATEALLSVIRYTFMHTDINRIEAFHRARNPVSGKVLAKAGLKFEGIQRGAYRYANTDEYDDKVLYGLTRKDFEGV